MWTKSTLNWWRSSCFQAKWSHSLPTSTKSMSSSTHSLSKTWLASITSPAYHNFVRSSRSLTSRMSSSSTSWTDLSSTPSRSPKKALIYILKISISFIQFSWTKRTSALKSLKIQSIWPTKRSTLATTSIYWRPRALLNWLQSISMSIRSLWSCLRRRKTPWSSWGSKLSTSKGKA